MLATCANIEKLKNDGVAIVDIRLESEWRATGIVEGCHTITFFDEQGGYDAQGFIEKMQEITSNGENIAVLCRTASRTGMLAPFLQEQLGKDVVDLEGGIMSLIQDGYKTIDYK